MKSQEVDRPTGQIHDCFNDFPLSISGACSEFLRGVGPAHRFQAHAVQVGRPPNCDTM